MKLHDNSPPTNKMVDQTTKDHENARFKSILSSLTSRSDHELRETQIQSLEDLALTGNIEVSRLHLSIASSDPEALDVLLSNQQTIQIEYVCFSLHNILESNTKSFMLFLSYDIQVDACFWENIPWQLQFALPGSTLFSILCCMDEKLKQVADVKSELSNSDYSFS